MVKAGLLYTKEHDWILVEGDKATLGISDYAQHALGDVVFADGEPVGSSVKLGGPLGVVESVKAASDIVSPLSGKLVSINDAVIDEPALLNQAPYDNHLFVIEMSNKSELDAYMDAAAYEAFVATLH